MTLAKAPPVVSSRSRTGRDNRVGPAQRPGQAEKLERGRALLSAGPLSPVPQVLDQDRHDGDENDRQDHQSEVLFHRRQAAEIEAGKNEEPGPDHSAEDVVSDKAPIGHRSDTCYEGREGADDGNEARQEDRLPAVPLVELLRAKEILPLDEANVLPEDAGADAFADRVVDRVTGDRSHRQEPKEIDGVERSGCGQGSRGKKQRIAGQDGSHHQARLTEDDDEKQQIRPGPVGADDVPEMLVQVNEEVPELRNKLHRLARFGPTLTKLILLPSQADGKRIQRRSK